MRRRVLVVRRTMVRVVPGVALLPAGPLCSRDMRNVILVIASLLLFLLGLGLSQKMAEGAGRSRSTLDAVLRPSD